MTAASAPSEEGKRCWLKVTYEGRSRMVEWNTNLITFKEMDTKVKKMFGVHEKWRLIYTYQETTTYSDIVMSSDEELSTALHLMQGEILVVDAVLEKKKKKSPVAQAYRAYRAAQPQVRTFLTNLPANASTHLCALATRACLTAQCAFECVGAKFVSFTQRAPRAGPSQQPARPPAPSVPAPSPAPAHSSYRFPRKLALCFFFLVLAVMVAHSKYHARMRNEWMEVFNRNSNFKPMYKLAQLQQELLQQQMQQQHQQQQQQQQHNYGRHHEYEPSIHSASHVTILAATYGGRDVTRTVQEFYNSHNWVLASNSVFGDPAYGMRKYLHVVYQHRSPTTGVVEVLSQAFPESESPMQFTLAKDACAFPEEAIVDGRSVKVLGALYDDVSATCAARRYAATGRFTASQSNSRRHRDTIITGNHFGTFSSVGSFTLVYLKDNTLRTFVGREGDSLAF